MSATLILLVVAATCCLVALVVHAVMVVHGFKTSVGWGLACLLVPLASLVFAFTRFSAKGKPVWAGLFLVTLVGGAVCGGIASYQTAQAAIGGEETMKAGMEEFEKATEALDGLEDLQLGDLGLDTPAKAGRPAPDAGER